MAALGAFLMVVVFAAGMAGIKVVVKRVPNPFMLVAVLVIMYVVVLGEWRLVNKYLFEPLDQIGVFAEDQPIDFGPR